jgi:paraquat-inducible protein B
MKATKSILFAFPLSLFLSFAAFAGSSKEPVQLNLAAGNVAGQIQAIQSVIGEPQYSEMTADSKSTLNSQLAALQQGQLDSVGAVEAQNQINGILKQAFADSRMVCTYDKPLGSNMKQRVCKTVAAKRRQHQKTQNATSIGGPTMSPGN